MVNSNIETADHNIPFSGINEISLSAKCTKTTETNKDPTDSDKLIENCVSGDSFCCFTSSYSKSSLI